MPQLPPSKAAALTGIEDPFVLMEAGPQVGRLTKVEVTNDGATWRWEFITVEDSPRYAGRKNSVYTDVEGDRAWKLKQVFEAFGVDTDTNTDTLIGRTATLLIGQYTRQKGDRKGELANSVNSVQPGPGPQLNADEIPF